MAFVLCREKSDKGRSISLSVCSCSVSKFELQRFNKTKKATGFKSQGINCQEIHLVTSKCQMNFSDKTYKKRSNIVGPN